MKALPPLPYQDWRETRDTLHRWLQVVGKVQLGLTPRVNHWWNVPFNISAHGLSTSLIECGECRFDIEIDFIDSMMRIRRHEGPTQFVELRARSVADFYRATMTALRAAGIDRKIWTMPVEIAHPIPFELDEEHRAYDKLYVLRWWEIVSRVSAVLQKFRARFVGKCSAVQLFWGTFDLAVSRFSGRRAPPFDTNSIEREAYSHELIGAGWWPGDERLTRASFFSYAAPEPIGFPRAQVAPAAAYYHGALKGFYLDHDAVCGASDPEGMLLDFFTSVYSAAADLGKWPRADLERNPKEDHRGNLYASEDEGRRPGEDDWVSGVSETWR